MSASLTRILIADDHAVLRAGLRLLLEKQPDLHIAGEASTGTAVLALAEEVQPDLILLDLSMPGLGGLEALPMIQARVPEAKVLILTMYDDPHYLRRSLEDGASGYIPKKAADTELLSAIRAVMRGEVYVHSSMTRSILAEVLPTDESNPQEDIWETLSEREQQVLHQVALGHTSAEIAGQLILSPKTVETYRARGMEKLGLRSRAALVRFALARGLLSLD